MSFTTKLFFYLDTKVMHCVKRRTNFEKEHARPRQDSNLESSDPKSDALSIRPQGQAIYSRISHIIWQSWSTNTHCAIFSNLSSVYAMFEVNTFTSLHFIDGQRNSSLHM